MDQPISSIAFGALHSSSDIPTTAFNDRLAHRTGEQGGTDFPQLPHVFTSFGHGVGTNGRPSFRLAQPAALQQDFTCEHSILFFPKGNVAEGFAG